MARLTPILAFVCVPLLCVAAAWAQPREIKLDFGTAQTQEGFVSVSTDTAFSAERGFGWIGEPQFQLRDREAPDALRRDYIFGRSPATFRVTLQPGTYRMTLVMGDMLHGDHVLQPKVNVQDVNLPVLRAAVAEFATLTSALEVKNETLDITFDSPVNNWVINAMILEPADQAHPPEVGHERFPLQMQDTWGDVAAWPDPTKPHLEQFRERLETDPAFEPTRLTRRDYLKVIESNVDFWKQHQDAEGAIIDPYREVEFQYSTPCFALAAATLVAHADRADLLEPAAKAMDWATLRLSQRQGATAHEDFYSPPLAHALPLLEGRVEPERAERWKQNLASFEPIAVYRAAPGSSNWNVVALSGEWLFHKLGLRPDASYVEASLAAQGRHFDSHWGLYTEGPMPYDHFPRLWAADMLLAHGYDGENADKLREVLRRAALTSLFMQSPSGELPTGGRSAHHQWNEAQQCVTFELYAAEALANGDEALAGAFKRGAHLSLQSIQRWVRPSGELWIVKNHLDPAEQHGYEGYSGHSQYNLLAMAMLAIAYEHSEPTENVREFATPADVGGFVLDIADLHKVIANAGGLYIQIDTAADLHHNPTGLLRIHKSGLNPQLGPSDGLSAHAGSRYPQGPRTTAAIGAAWQDSEGNWRRLAEFGGDRIKGVRLLDVQQRPERVSFRLEYAGDFGGPSKVVESYVVTPDHVELSVELPGYAGPARLVWPVLADNGAQETQISVDGTRVSATLGEDTQVYDAHGAQAVEVEPQRYPFRNGWARIAIAEFGQGSNRLTLRIEPQPTTE